MNYLAHTLLSKNQIDYQLGNLLADVLKGEGWVGASQQHLDGLNMHKQIDKFTDNSHIVRQALSTLGSGYLKGVVLDITFDYFLSKHWNKFVTIEKDVFIQNFYEHAKKQGSNLPSKANEFVTAIAKYDILGNYNTLIDLEQVFQRVNRRLSPRLLAKENTTDYLPRITENYDKLEQDFLQFFPTLIALFLQQSQAKSSEHLFKLDLPI